MDKHDYVREFVDELLRTGLTLVDLLSNLIDSLPGDAFPGEEPAEAVVAMLTETIRPVATAAGERSIKDATALLCASAERTLADMRAAVRAARDSAAG